VDQIVLVGGVEWIPSIFVCEIVLLWHPLSLSFSRDEPFGNDKHIHPCEQTPEDNDLGNEFKEKILGLPEVERVESFKEDTKRHLKNSEDD
jgi:hypothetical protein